MFTKLGTMRIIPTVIIAISVFATATAQSNEVLIDNFSNTNFANTTVYTDPGNGYSVARTISNTDNSNFVGISGGFQDIYFGGTLPYTAIATFNYVATGGTFGDIWSAATGVNPPLTEGIEFGYSANGANTPNYFVTLRAFDAANGVIIDTGPLGLVGTNQTFNSVREINEVDLNSAVDIELIFSKSIANNGGFGVFSIQDGFTVVPEPTTIMFFGMAIAGFGLRRRR